MKDVGGGIEIIKDDGYFEIVTEISAFSLHSGVDRDAIVALLKENSEKTYNVDGEECLHVYQYSRNMIENLAKLDETNHYGEDFTMFLNELFETESDVFYIDIC